MASNATFRRCPVVHDDIQRTEHVDRLIHNRLPSQRVSNRGNGDGRSTPVATDFFRDSSGART